MRLYQQELHLYWNLSTFLSKTLHSALFILIDFIENSFAYFRFSLFLCDFEEKINVGAFLGESLMSSEWSACLRIYSGVIGP